MCVCPVLCVYSIHVCVFVCECTCVYMCVYVHVYIMCFFVLVCLCMCILCVYVCVCVYTCMCACVCVFVCVSPCMYTCICVWLCMYLCLYKYAVRVHACMIINAAVEEPFLISVCTCMHTCPLLLLDHILFSPNTSEAKNLLSQILSGTQTSQTNLVNASTKFCNNSSVCLHVHCVHTALICCHM